MPVDPLAQRGFRSAAAYEHGRPGYAQQALQRLASELRLSRSTRLLDLAAGTGLLSRALAASVGSIVAVEPSQAMRDVLAEKLPAAEVVAGEAERLPLANASVDAIVVGEAFHWFEGDAAAGEMARVLRPDGAVALLWNVLLAVEPPWTRELAAEVKRRRAAALPGERRYGSGHWRRAFDRSDRFEALSRTSAEHEQRLDRDGFVAQIASWSTVASLPEPERGDMLERVQRLTPATCVLTWRTDLHWTRLSRER